MVRQSVLAVSLLLAAVASCTPSRLVSRAADILWDGRVPTNTALSVFDTSSSEFNDQFVLGQNLTWSQVLKFPSVTTPSLFDGTASKAIEVTISDASIFNSGGPQTGFRRAELLPSINSGSDVTVQGITTHHFSIMSDPQRHVNVSHEYQIVFIETQDFSSHVFTVKTGTAFGDTVSNTRALRIEGSTASQSVGNELFSVAWQDGVWYNFAVNIDWNNNLISVFHSTNNAPLAQVVQSTSNDATGKGQFHVGVLKLPMPPSTDVVHMGFQESGINEGIIYGGVFVESGSTVTLSN